MGRYGYLGTTTKRITLKGRSKGKGSTVTKRVTFPDVQNAHPFLLSLWTMRRISSLIEDSGLKGPDAPTEEQIRRLAREVGLYAAFPEAKDDTKGAHLRWQAVNELLWRFKRSTVPSDVQDRNARVVGVRVFRNSKGAWIDTAYRASMRTQTVAFLGQEYFEMVKQHPELGACFALGPEVTAVLGDTAIRVTGPSAPPR